MRRFSEDMEQLRSYNLIGNNRPVTHAQFNDALGAHHLSGKVRELGKGAFAVALAGDVDEYVVKYNNIKDQRLGSQDGFPVWVEHVQKTQNPHFPKVIAFQPLFDLENQVGDEKAATGYYAVMEFLNIDDQKYNAELDNLLGASDDAHDLVGFDYIDMDGNHIDLVEFLYNDFYHEEKLVNGPSFIETALITLSEVAEFYYKDKINDTTNLGSIARHMRGQNDIFTPGKIYDTIKAYDQIVAEYFAKEEKKARDEFQDSTDAYVRDFKISEDMQARYLDHMNDMIWASFQLKRLAKMWQRQPKLHDALKECAGVASKANVMLDLHSGNFGTRGGYVVISDPFAFYHTGSKKSYGSRF